ncbi:DUF1365 domain-containing protein [Nocardioides alcanivorans]|uniref:DUF1365 domain-containing protein n=1 Tax=Nocardioides alcanivorans TaxID=2897352 RepID=UPI001F168CAB|nr:DUF1365 domain-containing protein [Nocardioides alcanivorans]
MTQHLELPALPALVVGRVGHVRHRPVRHSFEHAHYQWLVDLDDLPRLAWPVRHVARFDARDHLDRGRRGGGIRGDLSRWLARRGVTLDEEDSVVMLAHARVLGHVFDPLTVFWCLRPDGSLRAVVLEVHNTYDERHAYLIEPDEAGHAEVAKEFYVSPFNDAEGDYAVELRLDPGHVRVGVTLRRDGQRILTAVTAGSPVLASNRTVARTAARHLFMTHRVSALIRWHGIRLWFARLPVRTRQPHSEEAVR